MKNQRWICISVLIAINLGVLLFALRHSKRSRPQRVPPVATLLTRLSLSNNISRAQFEEATNSLAEERRMWSRFRGLEGNLSVELDGLDAHRTAWSGRVVLQCTAGANSMLRRNPRRWDMRLLDDSDSLLARTDGSPSKTVILSRDTTLAATLKAVAPSTICQMLTSPQYIMLTLCQDDLYPDGMGSFEAMLQSWQICLSASPSAPPLTCSFIKARQNPIIELTLSNQRLARWRRATADQRTDNVLNLVTLDFRAPVFSDGFWYPSTIEVTPAPTPWPYPDMLSQHMLVPYPKGTEAPLEKKGRLRLSLSKVSLFVR